MMTSSERSIRSRKSCLKDSTKPKTPSQEYALKKVFFDEIEVREYPQILGDNPAVTVGAPVTIDWDFDNEYQLSIDMYEFTREPMRRRGRRKLMLSSKRRLQRLIDAGYTAVEIGEAIVEVDRAKSMRLDSVQGSDWNGTLDNLTGAVKFTGRGILKVGRRGSKILTAAVEGMKIKLPKRKSITNPAC